jgi:hypothetical protein
MTSRETAPKPLAEKYRPAYRVALRAMIEAIPGGWFRPQPHRAMVHDEGGEVWNTPIIVADAIDGRQILMAFAFDLHRASLNISYEGQPEEPAFEIHSYSDLIGCLSYLRGKYGHDLWGDEPHDLWDEPRRPPQGFKQCNFTGICELSWHALFDTIQTKQVFDGHTLRIQNNQGHITTPSMDPMGFTIRRPLNDPVYLPDFIREDLYQTIGDLVFNLTEQLGPSEPDVTSATPIRKLTGLGLDLVKAIQSEIRRNDPFLQSPVQY